MAKKKDIGGSMDTLTRLFAHFGIHVYRLYNHKGKHKEERERLAKVYKSVRKEKRKREEDKLRKLLKKSKKRPSSSSK